MTRRKGAKRMILIVAAVAVVIMTVLCFLLYQGILQLNNPPRDKYPVRGVDVSEYQGEIDWALLSSQNIKFAFVKATEGSQY